MFIAILIILLFVVVSCTVIAMCSIYINTHVTDCENVDTTIDCPNASCTDIEQDCYCNKNIFASLNDASINAYCGDKIDQIYIAQSIQYAVVAISALTNFLFGFVIGKIVDFTRPNTNSSGLITKTIIYTLFLIFNTVFIPILIYSDVYGFKTTDYVSLLTIVSADLKGVLKV